MDEVVTDEVVELLLWSYYGEVRGEALFRRLAAGFSEQGDRDKVAVLGRLERQTKERIRVWLDQLGLDRSAEAEHRARGEANADAVLAESWDSFLGAFDPVTTHAIDRYRRLRDVAPSDGLRELGQHLIDHEAALRDFARLELAGDQGSLAPAHALLIAPGRD